MNMKNEYMMRTRVSAGVGAMYEVHKVIAKFEGNAHDAMRRFGHVVSWSVEHEAKFRLMRRGLGRLPEVRTLLHRM